MDKSATGSVNFVHRTLGGFLFYEADDLDAAIELASKIPAARMGGSGGGSPTQGAVTLGDAFCDERRLSSPTP